MGQGKSGFGVKIGVEMDPIGTPGVITRIGGLVGDIPYPDLSHPETEATEHGEPVDDYVVAGYTARSLFKFSVNFNYNDATHDHLTGLYHIFEPIYNIPRGWQITGPLATPGGKINEWLFSGQIQMIQKKSAQKGVQSADVSIRPKGAWWIDGIKFGVAAT